MELDQRLIGLTGPHYVFEVEKGIFDSLQKLSAIQIHYT